MKNKELRKKIVTDGTLKNYTKTRREMIKQVPLDQLTTENLSEWLQISEEEAQECERARHCRAAQVKKVEDHIRWLIEHNYVICFFTCTIDDDHINLKYDTLKQKVRRILAKTDDYILNADYAPNTDRLHWHGITAVPEESLYIRETENGKHLKCIILDEYEDYGYYSIERIRTEGIDVRRLAEYIAKLVLHSVKVRQSYISVKKGSEYQKAKAQKEWIEKATTRYANYTRNTAEKKLKALTEQIAIDYMNSEECPF